ncbi:MAG: endonuclease/exonuclease/phosphatase family protein [Ktedonobacteraceae bacterium]
MKIMSYNILLGGEDRIPHITNVIREQQPDVVALLEANSRENVETLARKLDMQFVFGEANSEFHVAWLSRLPVVRSENHRLPALAKTLLEIELQWERRRVHLFAAHLQHKLEPEYEQKRVAEVRAILDVMSRLDNRPRLLAGDLNTLRPGDTTGVATDMPREAIPLLLNAGYIDCYRRIHPISPGYTYKLPEPSMRIDYVFASIEMALHLHKCAVVSNEEAQIASDHLPILAEFQ